MLAFGKMLSKSMYLADNFLLQYQYEPNTFIDAPHFGIEPSGFQTPLTLELISQTIINPECCTGKYPRVKVVNEAVNNLLTVCRHEEKQRNLNIATKMCVLQT